MRTLPKLLTVLAMLFISQVSALAQTVDTLYYDKDWKGVTNSTSASFYRVIDTSKKHCRDYYITGQLQGESDYISIDKNDDEKSIFDGEVKNFYKSGILEGVRFYKSGKPEGDAYSYYENGNVKYHVTYKDDKATGTYEEYYENGQLNYQCPVLNGQLNGTVTKYNEKGDSCFQAQVINGQPYNWHVVSIEEADFTQQIKG